MEWSILVGWVSPEVESAFPNTHPIHLLDYMLYISKIRSIYIFLELVSLRLNITMLHAETGENTTPPYPRLGAPSCFLIRELRTTSTLFAWLHHNNLRDNCA
jgi:hypothetical protein